VANVRDLRTNHTVSAPLVNQGNCTDIQSQSLSPNNNLREKVKAPTLAIAKSLALYCQIKKAVRVSQRYFQEKKLTLSGSVSCCTIYKFPFNIQSNVRTLTSKSFLYLLLFRLYVNYKVIPGADQAHCIAHTLEAHARRITDLKS
jgi:hypothetical protein